MVYEHDHHDHDHGHSHAHATNQNNLRRVMIALVLTGAFMVVEIVGGIITHDVTPCGTSLRAPS